jgi:hypothetical protein
MRRYGTRSDSTVVPGNDSGLSLVMQPVAEACAEVVSVECEPDVTGLFWFSDSTGAFDQDVEAAYLLAEGAAGPLLGLAKLVGETCDLPVTWTKTWMPESGTGGDPGYFEDGARLVVYPLADTAPGVLEVSAEHDGQSYGPILLTVLRYSCYCYCYGSAAAQAMQWFDFQAVFSASGAAGIAWTANPKACTPASNSGQCAAALTLNPGYTLPAGNVRVRLTYVPTSPPPYWEFRFYMNTVSESFYLTSLDAMPAVFTVPASYSNLSMYFPYDWTNGALTLEIECFGP